MISDHPSTPPNGCAHTSGTVARPAGYESSTDRYILRDPLGRGALGTVHRATDLVTGHEVAFKVFHRRFLPRSADRARFSREARALASVDHANVVRVSDMGFDHIGHPYLVTELLPGETLDAFISRGPVDVDSAIRITVRLLSALAAAHRAGITQRELLPSDLMVARVGGELMVKLVDFGISRRFGESERASASGSTATRPPFMSPEQLMGDAVGPTSDVYAAGCMLFELLTGRPAFPTRGGRSVADHFRQVLTAAAPRVSDFRAMVPENIDRIVGVALQRDRLLRYPDCDAMRYALLEATGQRSSRVPAIPAERTEDDDARGVS